MMSTSGHTNGNVQPMSAHADPLEEQAVHIAAEAIAAIFNPIGAAVTDRTRFRARQIVGHLKKANLLKTTSTGKTIPLDRAKAIEIQDQLQYMHDRLGTEPGRILALANHLAELINQPSTEIPSGGVRG